MAAQEEINNRGALFPPPPPFFKHFKSENRDRLKALREEAGIGKSAATDENSIIEATRLLDLPPELRYLVPPEPPVEGKFRGFGIEQDINASAQQDKDPQVQQLYPSPPEDTNADSEWTLDSAKYLRIMVRGILLNFLELVGILSQDPQQYAQKIDHIHQLLRNAHQLINIYRPHQARETLIMMMEDQLEKKKKEVEDIKNMREKIDALLNGPGKDGLDSIMPLDGGHSDSGPDDRRRKIQLEAWAALDEELRI